MNIATNIESQAPISIYVDTNVWDFLFDRRLDLSVELPRSEFCLCVTREAEFEIPAIPSSKPELRAFVEETIVKCHVRTDSFFGFFSDGIPPEEQRYGGFDVGRWITEGERVFIEQQTARISTEKRPTKLYKNEADVSIAARSFHAVVLTLDGKGPINEAYKQGGKIVFLTNFDRSGLSLREFIKAALGRGR